VREAVEGRFPVKVDGLTLTPIADWPAHVRGLLGRWLFQFADRTGDHLADPRRSFSVFDDHFRGMLLDEAVGRLSAAVNPLAVWGVEVRTSGWYECRYEDLAFEEAGQVLYLHAGHSD
jgi:hypothetical protein